jgi:catechol 2,3-dioxygenase-like lactoylglutathione lyase family enzyme
LEDLEMSTLSVTLEHANLNVTDLDRALEFYRRLLPGWVIRWEGATSGGEPWIHFGPAGEGQPGYLSIYQDRGATAGGEDRLGVQHLGFAHPDVETLVAELARGGIHPTDRMDDGRWRRAYFLDPDGHELEMVERVPGR